MANCHCHGPIRIVILVREDNTSFDEIPARFSRLAASLRRELLSWHRFAAPHCDLDDDQVIRAGNAIDGANIGSRCVVLAHQIEQLVFGMPIA